MTNGDLTHVGVLLENIQTSVKVIAEGHLALVEGQGLIVKRLDQVHSRLDGLEMRFEVFASDTKQRLTQIESHLGQKPTSVAPPKRRKKA